MKRKEKRESCREREREREKKLNFQRNNSICNSIGQLDHSTELVPCMIDRFAATGIADRLRGLSITIEHGRDSNRHFGNHFIR